LSYRVFCSPDGPYTHGWDSNPHLLNFTIKLPRVYRVMTPDYMRRVINPPHIFGITYWVYP